MLDITTVTGLTHAGAAARLAADGPNELPTAHRRTFWHGLRDVVREPMTALLIGCGAIYFVLGDREEALMLVGFVGLIVAITLYQERKTERAVEALRELASPRALVIREGAQRRIAGREVVRGDILVISEGDRVAADARILATSHCTIDESLLTGESVAVGKGVIEPGLAPPAARPGGEGQPFVFAGTLVVQGTALAEVTATGAATEMGRIGTVLGATATEDTRLQRETQALVWKLALVAGALSIAVVVVYGLTRHDWLGGILAGLTLAMAILPNEFPVVVTIFLALGAWRLSRRRVLTRRIPAVEALGSVTVLCVDKTGTLTENRMTVSRLEADGVRFEVARLDRDLLPEEVHAIVEYAVLASRKDPFDPMEVAFTQLAHAHLAGTEHLHPSWTLVREYPISRERLTVIQIWRGDDGAIVVACKGAPEAVARACRVDAAAAAAITGAAETMAGDGLRVLAVARGALAPDEEVPDDPTELALTFVGLVGLADPVRATVPAAIAECREAGIRVVIITGDYPATAQSIARQVGLGDAPLMTGAELATLDDAALAARIDGIGIFARIMPEQKLRIVQALKAQGEIVAMTGDGVNDAPALKAATIGIAMGGRGTDVAREAAQLVLLDDDFASLVTAVRTGRRIYDNLQKALAYILAIHLPVLALTVVPILVGWPLVLMPIHIAFLHLVIDPACSIVFEAEPDEAGVMKRPPRPAAARLFGRQLLLISLSLGASVTAILLGAFAIAHYGGRGDAEARAFTFTILILANLGLIISNRTWHGSALGRGPKNPALWWVGGGALAFLAIALYVPAARALFRFDVLHPIDVAICLGATALGTAWFELLKVVRASRASSAARAARA
ncbi:MAG: cation-translocating P-type ATPase [Deltaproteobacteria bacterium]|nr:cation-translocating P-type ATPase [Deltaproteobacteria bacterium]